MQHIQSFHNGLGSLFVSGTGDGERSLNTTHHHQGFGDEHGGGERYLETTQHHQGFADGLGGLKCPRCGSLNTKFCYYNNYNLSQPRFFCKGCRRYWTKGGVLRNVPVGGGSRKTKRSKKKTGTGKPSSAHLATSGRKSTNSQNSSSHSISPETTPCEAAPMVCDQSFEPPVVDQCSTDNVHQLVSEMGKFGSLMTSSSDELYGFSSAPEVSPLMQQGNQDDQVVENQEWDRQQWLQATGGVTEDWGLIDQPYWLNNNPDYQVDYLL